MKKVLSLLGVFILAFWGVANATPITNLNNDVVSFENNTTFEGYEDYGWGAVNKLDCFGDYISWTHEFDLDEGLIGISDATLTLVLGDDRDSKWRPYEFAFYAGEDKTIGLWEVDSEKYTFGVSSEYLMDGEFSGMLTSVGGDFFVKSATLSFLSDVKPVPEPATILLFGAGLVGLAGACRKTQKK